MRTRQQVVNAAIYLFFSVAGSALGFGAVVVLTRLIAPHEYGRIGLFLSMLYFITPLVSLSCDGLIAVNKTTLAPERYQRFQQTCVGLGIACFAVCETVMLSLLAAGLIKDWLLTVAPLFALVRLFTGIAGTEYIAEQRAMMYGSLMVANSALALALTVVFAHWVGESGAYRILAMLLADLALLAVRYWGRLHLLFSPRLRTEFTRQILQFGIPSGIAVAGGWALNESDKVIVATTLGMESVGIYTAAAALAGIMMTFNQALTNALYPGLFRSLASGERTVRRVMSRYIAGFTAVSFLFALCGILVYLLFADRILPARYLGANQLFIALMLSGVVVSFYRPFGLVADYHKLARTRAIALIVGGLVTVSISYFGVRSGNLIWAPVGIAGGYLTAAAVLLTGINAASTSK
jgi:O-antigen/teichoic acid export membrane protein